MARAFLTHPITDDSALGGSVIERSLRFNDDDGAYLSRDFGSGGNRKKWTFSAWIKRSNLGAEQRIFGGDTNASHIFIASNDELTWDVAAPGSSASGNLNTELVSRDPLAWFHLVCALDTDESTADNRMRMYVNGSEITDFGSRTNPSSGYALNAINADGDRATHTIGRRTSAQGTDGMRYDGYMAEVHFIDGQQYDPSYFGYTDSQTGIWRPKRYEGTYGTTGFHLEFKDNSSTSALGKDTSGNGNDFTTNNFSVATGSAANIYNNDSVLDTPSDRYATLNSVNGYSYNTTFANGNLFANIPASNTYGKAFGNIPIKSGKWYWEVYYNQAGGNGNYLYVGLETPDGQTFKRAVRGSDGEQFPNTGATAVRFATGDIINVAVDLDAGKWYIGRNGTYWYSGNPVAGTGFVHSDLISANASTPVDGLVPLFYNATSGATQQFSVNFGQKPFIYTPPTGYKTINSKNLPPNVPSVIRPQKHFDNLLYTATGNAMSVTGLEFKPDFIWQKRRDSTGGSHFHYLFDSVRGGRYVLQSNTTGAESDSGDDNNIVFKDGGFDMVATSGGQGNGTGGTYVAWCWKGGGSSGTHNIDGVGYATAAAAGLNGGTITPTGTSINTISGLSIIAYTGNGTSGASMSHGLPSAPKIIFHKDRDSTNNWYTITTALDGSADYFYLNLNNAKADSGVTVPTSNLVYFTASSESNHNGRDYIMYAFCDIPGYSKIGSYTGNGSTNGTYVHLGFRPAFIMIKSTSQATDWDILTADINGYNVVTKYINANSGSAEGTYTYGDLLSNGFKARNSGGSYNQNGGTYVYIAFAEQPGITPYDTQTNAR